MEKDLERNLKRGLENIASAVREMAVSIDDIPKRMDVLKKMFSCYNSNRANDNVDIIRTAFVSRGGYVGETEKSTYMVVFVGLASRKTIRMIESLKNEGFHLEPTSLNHSCEDSVLVFEDDLDKLVINKINIDESVKDYEVLSLLENKYMQPSNLICRDYVRRIKDKSLKKRIFIHQNR